MPVAGLQAPTRRNPPGTDDNVETIRKRFRTFLGESMPVIEQLEARGVVHRVSAEASPDEVFSRVCAALAAVVQPSEQLAAHADVADAALGR